MNRDSRPILVVAASALACVLVAAGCGDSDETDTTTATGSGGSGAEQSVDSAVTTCTDSADQLGGAPGTALAAACKSVGDTATQALASGGEDAKQALSKAAGSCRSTVSSLPSGQAQDALTKLCDALASAG